MKYCFIFQNRQKIAFAKDLLNESSMTVKEIAFESGFNDEYYYTHNFLFYRWNNLHNPFDFFHNLIILS